MCGALHGPEHDDPAAAEVCHLYHGFARTDLPRLEEALSAREKELLWHVALGIGPEGLARRFDSHPEPIRAELTRLAGHLTELVDAQPPEAVAR